MSVGDDVVSQSLNFVERWMNGPCMHDGACKVRMHDGYYPWIEPKSTGTSGMNKKVALCFPSRRHQQNSLSIQDISFQLRTGKYLENFIQTKDCVS